ncbi:ParB/RepB/Spo0J family partition protein [Deinococcus radiophilus]|uniref:ParB/RepB/Spo0J family partition protein n=1 Tax=Deinococcus radiophilus TaxID=32062 RepID=A0A3S0KJF2_9DEIO|nr:ParB/RepB/Spo0J family partition protein [Deinococcus radiophilus]RTR28053.1 ParB/RepB/Spo0J family partition protein [Deinococcus radiophilus]UFA51494.1 ParB/RepB/Spo0J family partition protein [Deinococcus radiophilus]
MAKKVSAASRINLSRAVENYQREGISQIELDQIVVMPGHNPRGYATGDNAFSGPGFDALVASIQSFGDVFQPILLRPKASSNLYELVAGERRWRAAKAAGLTHISALVRELDDDQIVRIARQENELREAVSQIDLLFASLDQLARRLNVPLRQLRTVLIRARDGGEAFPENSPEAQVRDLIAVLGLPSLATLVRSSRLLNLTADERQAMREGLSQQAALALLDLGEDPLRPQLLVQALREGWSAAQLRREIQQLRENQSPTIKQVAQRVKNGLGERRLAQLPEVKRKKVEQLLLKLDELLAQDSHSP